MDNMTLHVLFRSSKKTGKIDTTMTGIGTALFKLWALQHTPGTKKTLIIERDTGIVEYEFTGRKDDMPHVEKLPDHTMCTEYGIPVEAVQAIKDERFD